MPKKQYVVKLTDEERKHLITLSRKGAIAARILARAHILRLEAVCKGLRNQVTRKKLSESC